MKKLIILLSLVLFISCTHTVHSLDVDTQKKEQIENELLWTCGENCEIEKCWSETSTTHVCDVKFSFVTDWSKKDVLIKTSKALSAKGLDVGFCGYDSAGTQVASIFLGVLGAGVAAGATGGGGGSLSPSGGSNMNVISVASNDVMKEACSSTPVIE